VGPPHSATCQVEHLVVREGSIPAGTKPSVYLLDNGSSPDITVCPELGEYLREAGITVIEVISQNVHVAVTAVFGRKFDSRNNLDAQARADDQCLVYSVNRVVIGDGDGGKALFCRHFDQVGRGMDTVGMV
jgi:hypothetical protein